MSISFSACDPLYAIDYSKLINATTSSKSIKAFTNSINSITNSNYLNVFDNDDDLFGLGLSMNTDIYSSLYNYNNVYTSSLSNSIINGEEKNIYQNKFQTEYENAMKALYDAKEIINLDDNNFSKFLNSSNEDIESIFEVLNSNSELTQDELKNILTFRNKLNDYKNVNDNFSKEQNEIDKLNEENEKIESLFDLIDAINKMYTDYNKKQREKKYY